MSTKYEISDLEYIFTVIQSQQTKIDNKANIFIAFHGVILGFLLNNLLASSHFTSVIKFSGIILMCSLITSIYKLIVLQVPKSYEIPPFESLNILNFAQISTLKIDHFIDNVINSEGNDRYLNDILIQIHVNSQILIRKQEKFKQSVSILKIGFTLSLLVCVLLTTYNLIS